MKSQFEKWYLTTHMPELLARPGFTTAQWVALAQAQGPGTTHDHRGGLPTRTTRTKSISRRPSCPRQVPPPLLDKCSIPISTADTPTENSAPRLPSMILGAIGQVLSVRAARGGVGPLEASPSHVVLLRLRLFSYGLPNFGKHVLTTWGWLTGRVNSDGCGTTWCLASLPG